MYRIVPDISDEIYETITSYDMHAPITQLAQNLNAVSVINR